MLEFPCLLPGSSACKAAANILQSQCWKLKVTSQEQAQTQEDMNILYYCCALCTYGLLLLVGLYCYCSTSLIEKAISSSSTSKETALRIYLDGTDEHHHNCETAGNLGHSAMVAISSATGPGNWGTGGQSAWGR